MSTTNTDNKWYWYIRQKETTGYIGIMNGEGAATTTASLNIDIWGYSAPTEITTDSDVLPIPPEFELGFIKGVASEIIQMFGKSNNSFEAAYNKVIMKARAKQVNESQQPMVISPLDCRDDE